MVVVAAGEKRRHLGGRAIAEGRRSGVERRVGGVASSVDTASDPGNASGGRNDGMGEREKETTRRE